MMSEIRITGAGGIIQNEIYLIADALRSVGYEVVVDDGWFAGNQYDQPSEIQKIKEHCISFNEEGSERRKDCGRMTVRIVANHIPWGG